MKRNKLIPDGADRLDGSEFDLVVFDVDGTLYDAAPMRRRMLRVLAVHCLLHPGAFADVRILRRFRICREELASEEVPGIGQAQFERPAQHLGVAPERVERVIRTWMFDRPLEYLRACRFPGVDEIFEVLSSAGKSIAILSDYPARRKLKALELSADHVVTALDVEVDCLKPQAQGLERVLELSQVRPSRALFVGDREDTDGICSRRAKVPFLRKVSGLPQVSHEFSDYRELAREMQRSQVPRPTSRG